MKPSFSIVIPTHNRKDSIVRAIESVLKQTYDGDFWVVVVDDGSGDGTFEMLGTLYEFNSKVRLVRTAENHGRTAARNLGRHRKGGDWIIDLDSDDEIVSSYLDHMAKAIGENPETKVFTCGALVYNDLTLSFHHRPTFVPKKGEMFGAGKIGTGHFCFHRSILVDLPESRWPCGGNGSFSEMAQNKWPALKELYGQYDNGEWKPLGNPWGDDHVMFFVLTRENQPVGIPLPLYLVHIRP